MSNFSELKDDQNVLLIENPHNSFQNNEESEEEDEVKHKETFKQLLRSLLFG